MILYLFNSFFYNPIYNLLVFLVHLMPNGDVGLAVLIITIIVRFVLLPFSLSATRTQQTMGALEPQLKEIRKIHKNDKTTQAEKTMALYREAKVNPFASIISVILQIPILIALYFVFLHEAFPTIDAKLLYDFVPIPTIVSMKFLGIIDIAGKSIILAALAGITQYIQATLALARAKQPENKKGKGATMDFSRMMSNQVRFIFPFIIAAIAYSTSGAIALYFVTTNTFGAFQELYVQHTLKKKPVLIEEKKPEKNKPVVGQES